MSIILFPRSRRPVLYFRLVAVVLVTALLSPGLNLEGFVESSASAANVGDTPVENAPPEPFILAPSSEGSTGSTLQMASSLIDKLNDSYGIALGFLASKKNILKSEQAMPVTAGGSVEFDFDNDGKADVGRWRTSNTQFEIKNSGGGANSTWTLGASTGRSAPADYDGDGKTDAAVFDNGTWTIRKSSNGSTQTINSFGTSGDIPVSGNYTGTGEADAAVYRPSNQTWYVREAVSGTVTSYAFGNSGDVAVPGNYDGDSYMDYAVFRPSTGYWYVQGTTSGAFNYGWGGAAGDVPVQGDYDGDGKTDYAIFRPVSGKWFAHKSSSPGQYSSWTWGNASDQPVPADYDGDGKADVAVWRPTSATWYILRSSDSNYETHVLGTTGDVAVPSAYFKQIGAPVAPYPLAQARLSPKNATGGTDFYSRNFSWGTSLVGLPGRAGMNAGFGMSYNSLVWTREANNIHFDADYSNISPGFRFGFPTIEPSYYDTKTGRFAYLMVTPSGSRIEFRQTAASDTYEAADSSYVQLKTKGASAPGDPVAEIDIVVTGTDGTQMTYDWKGGAFRCTEIKDRNGNYMTIVHDDDGLLRTVTDTLGRVITVNYDSQLYPISITQVWKNNNGSGSDVTHTWASLSYTTREITTSFSGLNVIGPANGTVLKVLERVTYGDGSSTRFIHNPYGQVWKVQNYAADNHELNRVKINLETPPINQTDCPRFTETRSWVENFNLDAQGVPQETLLTNSLTTGQSYSLPGGLNGIAAKIEVSMLNHPHNAVSKTFVGESGWMEGLPIATEDWADGTSGFARQRWTWNAWTQDDENLAYTLNPRVIESRVGDNINTKRTTIEYYLEPLSNIATYGLVKEAQIYDTDLSTVLKRAYTEYNLNSAYVSRRIIGLPAKTEVYGLETSGLNLVSKVTYAYDEGDFSDSGLSQNISPVQHDNTGYGALFTTGRGNLTSTTRWNVDFPTNSTEAVSQSVKYNTAGAVVSQISPGNTTGTTREVKISYIGTEMFSDTATDRNTYAYPTRIYDPAGNFSQVKYRYDIGANVEAKSPAPAGSQHGKKSKKTFDDIGRLLREAVWVDATEKSYIRYEYPANGVQSKVYATVTDANSNGPDTADEVLTESWADGAGRTRLSRSAYPGGTAGGFSGTAVEYNILGQVKRQSVPTEIDATWSFPVDTLWKWQEYDWRGRVTKSTNTDGTFSEAHYEGCGCAGGEVVTIEGEQLADGKRKQKVYSDIQGRQYKTEVLSWDGSVYSSTVTKFNGRDQAVWVKQFVGVAPGDALSSDSCPIQPPAEPQSCQITSVTYDGHARLKTQHKPQQAPGNGTIYDYYQNDEVHTVSDARGAVATYTYNNRGLVTNISHVMPSEQSGQGLTGCPYPEGCQQLTGSPYGWLDNVDTTEWKAKGWSFDPDNSSASNTVHFYIDGPSGTGPGSGTYIGQTVANTPRPDVNAVFGITGNHGFEFTIPVEHRDGAQHTLWAYGLDTGSDGPTNLSGSPKIFTFSPNTIQPLLDTAVSFEYDAVGNRISMTDNLGATSYEYDGLSRMTAETRQFTDTTIGGAPLVMANAPLSDNRFRLQYTYGLANQLTSLTDPYGAVINYGYDQAGRLNNVTGSSFANVTNYASGAEYEAWGALKRLNYGSGKQMTMTYNDRLQPATYNLSGGTGGTLMNKNYDYYDDGALRYVQDLLDPKFDRLQTYDHVGRIKQGKTGLEARGGTVPPVDQSTSLPYRQSYQFNAFGNLTQRLNRHWGQEYWFEQVNNLNYTYRNNRIQGVGWQYDADGRNLQTAAPDDYATSVYNAAGQMVRSASYNTDAVRWYDGNGREVKRQTANYDDYNNIWSLRPIKYYVRSSVLGNEVVSEVFANGKKCKTFVRAAGAQIAYQSAHYSDTSPLHEAVFFEYMDASGMSHRTTDKNGVAMTVEGGDGAPAELDPFSSNVGLSTPYFEILPPFEPQPEYPMLLPYYDDAPMWVNGQRLTCTLDGMAIGCSQAFSMLGHSADIDYRHTDPMVLSQLGIFRSPIYGSRDFDDPTVGGGSGSDDDPIRIGVGTETYFIGWEYHISWNPAQQRQERPLTQPEVTAVKENVKKNLSQKCKDFIRDLIERSNQLTGGNAVSDVNKILENISGFFGYLQPSNAHAVNNSLYLPISNYRSKLGGIGGDGRPYIARVSPAEFNAMSGHQQQMTQWLSFLEFSTSVTGAHTTIHELIHAAIGGTGDERFEAGLALAMTGQRFVVPEEVDRMTDREKRQAAILSAASNIFDDRLAEACGWQRRVLDKRTKSFIR